MVVRDFYFEREPGKMKGVKKCLFILFLTAVFTAAGAVTAVLAHEVELLESTPGNGDLLAESPPEVVARFSEELVSGESVMTVLNQDGAQVDNGDGGVNLNDPEHASMVVTLPPLPDGTYTVEWHAVLLDGDATDGAFAFAVGEDPLIVPTAGAGSDAGASQSGLPAGGIIAAAAGLIVLLVAGFLVMRRRPA